MAGARDSAELLVLMVEDDPLHARLLAKCLGQAGFSRPPLVVERGEDAIELLQGTGGTADATGPDIGLPDLILLDLQLPGLDGTEVLDVLKSDPRLRRIPVIMVSTSSEPSDVRRAYDSGANCYVTKAPTLQGNLALARAIESFWGQVATLPG